MPSKSELHQEAHSLLPIDHRHRLAAPISPRQPRVVLDAVPTPLRFECVKSPASARLPAKRVMRKRNARPYRLYCALEITYSPQAIHFVMLGTKLVTTSTHIEKKLWRQLRFDLPVAAVTRCNPLNTSKETMSFINRHPLHSESYGHAEFIQHNDRLSYSSCWASEHTAYQLCIDEVYTES